MGMYYTCGGRCVVDAYALFDYEVWTESERTVSCQIGLRLHRDGEFLAIY